MEPTDKSYPIFHPTDASPEFWDLMESGVASPSVACEQCGRHVYIPNCSEGDPEDEKEREGWIADNTNDAVFHTYFVGVHCVYGCPCNSAGLLESKLVANERDLAKFIRMRQAQLQKQSELLNIPEI